MVFYLNRGTEGASILENYVNLIKLTINFCGATEPSFALVIIRTLAITITYHQWGFTPWTKRCICCNEKVLSANYT